jgi:GDPmannose 4,6-dehydratase
MTKTALITGISGQDGSFLAEHLLSLNYNVHGLIRRLSVSENQDSRISGLDLNLHYGDLLDEHSLYNIINKVKPDEVYNLGAMSHVKVSFDIPSFTLKNNVFSVLNIIEFIKNINPEIRLYQASSSEMFGNSVEKDGYQKLTTPMKPVSPYGISKLTSYNLVRHYRSAYKLHLVNGILFNHESYRRGSNFITSKVVKGAVEIKKNIKNKLILGNLDTKRDWGYAKDYVRAMHLILNQNTADDWIVATGETRSVRDLCEYTFKKLSMNYEDYIQQDKKYMRPEELKYLKGDASKITNELGWKPHYTFEQMIDEMIEHWMKVTG